MGCSSCGQVSSPSQVQRIVDNHEPIIDCPYTQDILIGWMSKLLCAKEKGIFAGYIPISTLNAYLGIVQSAINYPTNPCYFKISLDPIQSFIYNISSQC